VNLGAVVPIFLSKQWGNITAFSYLIIINTLKLGMLIFTYNFYSSMQLTKHFE
jgi:hypothetical protein